MTGERTLDRGHFDCPKCGQKFTTSTAIANQVRNNSCCTPTERFKAKLVREDECLVYKGCRDKWGYAQLGIDGKRRQAHRYAWELRRGPIPAGLKVLHTCDNPPCCNPLHLFLGTDADNLRDKRMKGRDPKLLKPAQVLEIRALLGSMPQKEIAERFNVTAGVVSKLKLGKSYSEIT